MLVLSSPYHSALHQRTHVSGADDPAHVRVLCSVIATRVGVLYNAHAQERHARTNDHPDRHKNMPLLSFRWRTSSLHNCAQVFQSIGVASDAPSHSLRSIAYSNHVGYMLTDLPCLCVVAEALHSDRKHSALDSIAYSCKRSDGTCHKVRTRLESVSFEDALAACLQAIRCQRACAAAYHGLGSPAAPI